MSDLGTRHRWGKSRARVLASGWALDPLGDQTGEPMMVDQVSIVRIASVAAETGARMQRDGLAVDPLEWMTTPLLMFSGRPAIEACIDKDACARVFLLHGLGLDLDVDPALLEQLVLESEDYLEGGSCD
jgi:hypothetical protein